MRVLPAHFRLTHFIPFLFVAAVLSCGRSATAQTTTPPAQPRRATLSAEAADQEQFISYWTTETGWQSQLQLRNNLPADSLTVTPVLRLADGAERSLAPVTISPREGKVIDLDSALPASAPQFRGTYGSLVLRYQSPDSRNLYAVMMLRGVGKPFAFHIDAMGSLPDSQAAAREGIWWLPSGTTTDYLILTNQGADTIPLRLFLYDASGRQVQQTLAIGPRAAARYSIRQLLGTAGLAGQYGGLRVVPFARAGALDTLHILFDEQAGFSAILKMFDHAPHASIRERDYARSKVWTLRAPMLALANPDPALAFPEGTTLQPQIFVRNAVAKPVDLDLRFHWRNATTAGNAGGPTLHLIAYETRRIDVVALQDGNTLPRDAQWTSVTLTTNTQPDEVMAVAASYDATLRYGAQTPFSDQLSRRWSGGMWEYDAQHDSILTAGNGGREPVRAVFNAFWDHGRQSYQLEQTLGPDQQMWVDIGKLIREGVPDRDGTVLPRELASGTYEFRDATHWGAWDAI